MAQDILATRASVKCMQLNMPIVYSCMPKCPMLLSISLYNSAQKSVPKSISHSNDPLRHQHGVTSCTLTNYIEDVRISTNDACGIK